MQCQRAAGYIFVFLHKLLVKVSNITLLVLGLKLCGGVAEAITMRSELPQLYGLSFSGYEIFMCSDLVKLKHSDY